MMKVEAFAIACGTQVAQVHLLIEEGLLAPVSVEGGWRFGSESLKRARCIARLQIF